MFPPKRGRAALAASLAVSAALAVPALAAPERTGTLTATQTAFAWDGGPGNGVFPSGNPAGGSQVRCQPIVYECEDTLLDVKQGGTLTVEITPDASGRDLDLRLYRTDANGEVPAAENGFAEDITENAGAKVTVRNAKAGYYLARVLFYDATQATYKGTATISNFAVEAPAPVPATPAPVAPAPSKAADAEKKRKAGLAKCNKKAKKIKSAKKRKKARAACKKKYRKKT